MSTEFVPIAERDFVAADQVHFASLSGDRNPMHMSEIAARRTMAGLPVVHGIHTLLWALDALFERFTEITEVASIKVAFKKVVYVGDHVRLSVTWQKNSQITARAFVGTILVMSVQLNVGPAEREAEETSDGPLVYPTDPIDLSFAAMADATGRIPLQPDKLDDIARAFPDAARVLKPKRLAGLAATSFLVGMVCPGLHSLFGGLHLYTTPDPATPDETLQFRVAESDARFRLIKLTVAGGGWTGPIEAHARPEPALQAGSTAIAGKVAPDEFKETSALIVGGSRGLGELIAKIIAAGGGRVTITYSVGEADARRVQAEIVSCGGHCDIAKYDVRADAKDQIEALDVRPNELYYLATPTIFRRKGAVFDAERFTEFMTFYVTGFYDLCRALRSKTGSDISVFYPSSVFVQSRPADMTEYAMAKAAGEVLCEDMLAFDRPGPILVRRLPRLATDQTASLFEEPETESIPVILAVVRNVRSNRTAGPQKAEKQKRAMPNRVDPAVKELGFTDRNKLSEVEENRVGEFLEKAGVRKMPFSFATAISIVSDVDGSLRVRYDAYVGLLVESRGLDFGDSTWLQYNFMPDKTDGVAGFGFLSQNFSSGRNEPKQLFVSTRTINENVAEFHKGNVDHFHAFLPKGPRLAYLTKYKRADERTIEFELADFEDHGSWNSQGLYVFGVCVVSKPGTDASIEAVSIQVLNNGKIQLGSEIRHGRRKDERNFYLFRLPGSDADTYEAPRVVSFRKVCITCTSAENLASIDFVLLTGPDGELIIDRLSRLRDVYNVEAGLVTEHSGLHLRNPIRSESVDHLIQSHLKSNTELVGAYNGTLYSERGEPIWSTDSDDPDSLFCVFPDLTKEVGFRFVVPHAASKETGWSPFELVTPSSTRAGGGFYWARRVLPNFRPAAAGRKFDGHSRQDTFAARVLSVLDQIDRSSGAFWPIYTHLGGLRLKKGSDKNDDGESAAGKFRSQVPDPYFDLRSIDALQDRVFNISGTVAPNARVWLTRATTLYDYALILRSIAPHISRVDRNKVEIKSWTDDVLGKTLPCSIAQLFGLTVYVADPASATVLLDGREIKTLVHNPPDETGRRSVTVAECEIRYPVFDSSNPAELFADDFGLLKGSWRWDEALEPSGKLIAGGPEAKRAGYWQKPWYETASFVLALNGWQPSGAQFLTFEIQLDERARFGIILQTVDGGKFYFGDKSFEECIDSDVTATHFVHPRMRLPGKWSRITIPFHDLAWNRNAVPGGPMPSHPLLSISAVVSAEVGSGLSLRNVAFLRPRATELGGKAQQQFCVGGCVPNFDPEQIVYASVVGAPEDDCSRKASSKALLQATDSGSPEQPPGDGLGDAREAVVEFVESRGEGSESFDPAGGAPHSDADARQIFRAERVDQRGWFCFSGMPRGVYRIWTESDGSELSDIRGSMVEVSANVMNLSISRPIHHGPAAYSAPAAASADETLADASIIRRGAVDTSSLLRSWRATRSWLHRLRRSP